MDDTELEQQLAISQAYCVALLQVVQTLINLQPNQELVRAAVKDTMDRLIASTLANSTSDAFVAVVQDLQRQLPPPPAR